MDTAEYHRRCCETFRQRLHGVAPDAWARPTPCTDWDVRALVNHLVYEDLWTVPLFDGATVDEVGDRFEGDLLGADPVGAFDRAADAAIAAVSAPGALDRTVHLSFGDTPGDEYAHQLAADHLIHGWDLAVATGGERRLDPELVSHCATWFREREDHYRSGGAIGPRPGLLDDADSQDLLLIAFGRDPRWQPPAG